MFVNFPTGFRKSLIYQALPLIQCRYNLKGFLPYVVGVDSPLVKLMQEQVIHLRSLTSVSLSNIEENELKYVQKIFTQKHNNARLVTGRRLAFNFK